jgi:hypothetical protein
VRPTVPAGDERDADRERRAGEAEREADCDQRPVGVGVAEQDDGERRGREQGGEDLATAAESTERRVVEHVVGRRVDVRQLGSWNGAEPRTELLFVGLDPHLDQGQVNARLAEAVTASPPRTAFKR